MKRVAYHHLAAKRYDRLVPGLGERFLSQVERAQAFILSQPMLGLPEDARRRSWPVADFPYRVVYELEPERIRIIAVPHMSRKPGYWKRRHT